MATAAPPDDPRKPSTDGLTNERLKALQTRYNMIGGDFGHVGDHPDEGLTPERLQALQHQYNQEADFGDIGDSDPGSPTARAEKEPTTPGERDTAATSELNSLSRADNDKLQGTKDAFIGIGAANAAMGTEVGKPASGNWFKRRFWSNRKKQAATLAGSSGLVATVIAIVSFLGYSSGPLEFVHIAKLLTGPFSVLGHVNAASDYRMGKLLYQIYKTGDLGTFDAGDTRLGIVGKALKKPVLQGLEDRGITPEYGTLKTFDGFTVDISNPKSPYYGMSQEEALTKLQADLGNSKKLSFTWSDEIKTKIFVGGEGFNGDAAAIKATSTIIAKTYDNWLFGKVAAAMNSHFMFQYTEASTFHPLRKLQVQKTQQLVDLLKGWWSDRNEKIKNGVEPSNIDTANAKEQTTTTDKNGKPTTNTTDVPGETGPATAEGVKAKLSGLKTGASIAGALAGVVAIVCLLQAIDHNIGAIRYAQVMLPMMREAMSAISVGSQIMTGQDVDMNEVNMLASQFNAIDAKTHQVSSTWSSAAPIESLGGGHGGTDMDPSMKDMFSGAPAWLKWTENGAVTTLCGETAQVVVGVASVAIGIFSGEIISTVVGLVAGAIAGPILINFVSNLLAGAAVDPSTLAGAPWGNVIAYGARLSGNAQALQYGGVALNNQQVAELNANAEAQSQSEFHSQSLADRIFNPYDYRSVVGSAIDQVNISGGAQGVMATITNLPSLFGDLLRTPLSLFSSVTHAADTPYQYPFPEFGFSQADLTNPAVDDPVANAKAVGTLLDNNNTNGEPDYIQSALNCWGISVVKGADGWDAVPSTEEPSNDTFKQDRTRGVNAYDTATYNQGDCIKNNDLNWLRFRMWIYDTRLANGYSCYMGDQTSCNNDSLDLSPHPIS